MQLWLALFTKYKEGKNRQHTFISSRFQRLYLDSIMKILVLNAGSSSQKSCLFEVGQALPKSPPNPLWEAHIDWTAGTGMAEMSVKNFAGQTLRETLKVDSSGSAIRQMLDRLWTGPAQGIDQRSGIEVVGHRVVHGGHDYQQATLVTPEVRAAIASVAVFAPLHNRA